ncbi:MAG: CPBP family intramembrane metalloprotease [Victivallaceae bacterium]|nr:CPBP family intramembrane metalloprotease [Victivallaceae bacterium]
MCGDREKNDLSLTTALGAVALTFCITFVIAPLVAPRGEMPLWRWIAGIALPPVFLAAALPALFHFRGDETKITRPLRREWLVIAGGIVFALSAPQLATGIWLQTLKHFHWAVPAEQPLMELARTQDLPRYLTLMLTCVFFVPVAEELCFRRSIFSLFRGCGDVAASVAASAVFSAAHCFVAGIPGLFVLGMILQWVFIRTKNLAAAVIVHAIFNLTALLMVRILR